MAKFIYRMQSILNIKEKLEEQAKNEFAQARLRVDEEYAKLDSIIERRHMYEEEGRTLRMQVLDRQKLSFNQFTIDRIDEAIERQKEAIAEAEKALERARNNLTKAMQESQVQNKLKEKAFDQFKKDLVAQEMKEVDELTSYTYGQKK